MNIHLLYKLVIRWQHSVDIKTIQLNSGGENDKQNSS